MHCSRFGANSANFPLNRSEQTAHDCIVFAANICALARSCAFYYRFSNPANTVWGFAFHGLVERV